ncbi:MAG: hypothetical protein WCX48_08160 [Bacteroidales bacterium]
MVNRIHIIFAALFLCISSVAYSQEVWKSSMSSVAAVNMFHESSYISALGGFGNIEPLVFEANIVPYFTISTSRNARWVLELSPKVLLRMYNTESMPVRTPSYMPKVTFFYHVTEREEGRDWFVYLSWMHHSNGQDGSFFNADSCTINTFSGNFATNFLEGGCFISRPNKKRPNIIDYHKISLSYCYLMNSEIKSLYGRTRISYDYNTSINVSKKSDSKSSLIQSIRVGWIAGKFDDAKAFDSERLSFCYTISYKPPFLEDIGIFAQYYYGQDYYNLYFNRTLKVLRFGITAKMSISKYTNYETSMFNKR